MVGLYETAIDELCVVDGRRTVRVRPKIVASTATVRRAEQQIAGAVRAAASRSSRRRCSTPSDSFFARERPSPRRPAVCTSASARRASRLKAVARPCLRDPARRARRSHATRRARRDGRSVHDPGRLFQRLRELGGHAPDDRGRGRPTASARCRPTRGSATGATDLRSRTSSPVAVSASDIPRDARPASARTFAGAKSGRARTRVDVRPRDEHDLGRRRHRPARPDGGARPAEDHRRVHPGHQPRRPGPPGPGGRGLQLVTAARPSHYERSPTTTRPSTATSRRPA